MARRPAADSAAYCEHIIALARAGRIAKALTAEFESSKQTIRNWLFQSEADRGDRPGQLTSEERADLTRQRRENRQLKVEREILGKAAAWFARESGRSLPSLCLHERNSGPRSHRHYVRRAGRLRKRLSRVAPPDALPTHAAGCRAAAGAAGDACARDSWYEAAAGPPRHRGGTSCPTTITRTVWRRGARP
jgi:transposase